MIQSPSLQAVDLVGIYDENFRQLAVGARPIKAIVKPEARVMDHPVEDGSTITDHRVMLPIEIELSLMLADAANDYEQLRAIYRRAELVTVQTRTDVYTNMLISGMPHDESPELFDSVPLALRLREVQIVTAQFQALPPRQVARTRDASTVSRGQQSSSSAASTEQTRKSSTAYRIFGLGKGG